MSLTIIALSICPVVLETGVLFKVLPDACCTQPCTLKVKLAKISRLRPRQSVLVQTDPFYKACIWDAKKVDNLWYIFYVVYTVLIKDIPELYKMVSILFKSFWGNCVCQQVENCRMQCFVTF